jgi:metal-dependent amidase/aminoacylase/carboxypeptidase family protein
MEQSIRSLDQGVRERLEQRICAQASVQVEGFGGTVDIEYERGYPVVVNTDAETDFARGWRLREQRPLRLQRRDPDGGCGVLGAAG